jgi:hypothetical protein
MFTDSYLTSLAAGLGVMPPDTTSAWVIVHAVSLPEGEPLLGATIALAGAHGATFTRQADRSFVPGTAIAAGGAVLFTEVEDSDGGVTMTPPDGFAGECVGPAELATGPAAIKGAAFACQ